jgi:phage terminase small subunit
MEDLTIKQKIFVEEYLKNGGHGTKAAIAAGYSEKTAYSIACENLKKPEIMKYTDEAKKAAAERLGITAEYVLRKTRDIAEDAAAKDEHSAALKGMDMLGKHLKIWNETIDITSNGDHINPNNQATIDFSKLSTAALAELHGAINAPKEE